MCNDVKQNESSSEEKKNVYDTLYLIYNDGRGQGLVADLKFNVMGHLDAFHMIAPNSSHLGTE